MSEAKPLQLATGVFFCVDSYGFRSSIVPFDDRLASMTIVAPLTLTPQKIADAGPEVDRGESAPLSEEPEGLARQRLS